MRVRYAILAVGCICAWAAPIPAALGQQQDSSSVVQFLDDSPRTVTVSSNDERSFPVTVLNLTNLTRPIVVRATSPMGPGGASRVGLTIRVIQPNEDVVARNEGMANVVVQSSGATPGSYSSQLVAYSGESAEGSGGGLDRVPMTIVVTAGSRSDPDFTDSVTKIELAKTLVNCFHGKGDCPSSVLFESTELGHSFPTRGTVGWLVDESGQEAPLIGSPEGVRVDGLSEPGAYTGKLDLTPGEDGGEIELTANVKDSILPPAVALVAALLLAALIAWLLRGIALRRLKEAHGELLRRVKEANSRLKRPGAYAFEPQTIPTIEAFVSEAGKEHEQRLREADTDERRQEWEYGGKPFENLRESVEAYGKLTGKWIRLLADVGGLYQELASVASDLDQRPLTVDAFGALDVAEKVRNAISGDDPVAIHDPEDLNKREKDTSVAHEFVTTFRRVVKFLRGIEHKFDDDQWKAELVKAYKSLSGPGIADESSLDPVNKNLHQLAGLELPPKRQVTIGTLKEEEEVPTDHPSALVESTSMDLGTDPGLSLKKRVLLVSILSGTVVLLTGLGALYFPSETFGSVADYAKLATWGLVGEGAVRLLRTIGPSLLSATASLTSRES